MQQATNAFESIFHLVIVFFIGAFIAMAVSHLIVRKTGIFSRLNQSFKSLLEKILFIVLLAIATIIAQRIVL